MFMTVFIVKKYIIEIKKKILLKLESLHALYEIQAFRSNFLSNPQTPHLHRVEQIKVFQ